MSLDLCHTEIPLANFRCWQVNARISRISEAAVRKNRINIPYTPLQMGSQPRMAFEPWDTSTPVGVSLATHRAVPRLRWITTMPIDPGLLQLALWPCLGFRPGRSCSSLTLKLNRRYNSKCVSAESHVHSSTDGISFLQMICIFSISACSMSPVHFLDSRCHPIFDSTHPFHAPQV